MYDAARLTRHHIPGQNSDVDLHRLIGGLRLIHSVSSTRNPESLDSLLCWTVSLPATHRAHFASQQTFPLTFIHGGSTSDRKWGRAEKHAMRCQIPIDNCHIAFTHNNSRGRIHLRLRNIGSEVQIKSG